MKFYYIDGNIYTLIRLFVHKLYNILRSCWRMGIFLFSFFLYLISLACKGEVNGRGGRMPGSNGQRWSWGESHWAEHTSVFPRFDQTIGKGYVNGRNVVSPYFKARIRQTFWWFWFSGFQFFLLIGLTIFSFSLCLLFENNHCQNYKTNCIPQKMAYIQSSPKWYWCSMAI